jgi:hypothetical protein
MEQLSTVHDAIRDAALDINPEAPNNEVGTFKVSTDVKRLASEICSRNGTTLSCFLRKCCEGLIQDYLKGTDS